jgi:hypothetical protein
MSSVIILTAADAEAVRGMSTPTAAIEPIALMDGTFMLGIEVLADPAHARHLSKLSGLVTVDTKDISGLLFAASDVESIP